MRVGAGLFLAACLIVLFFSGCASKPQPGETPGIGFTDRGCVSTTLYPVDVNTTILADGGEAIVRVHLNYYCNANFRDATRKGNHSVTLVARVDNNPPATCVCARILEWSVPLENRILGVELADSSGSIIYSWSAQEGTPVPSIQLPEESRDPKYCETDSDCVPATCCHASECMNKRYELDCSGVVCTQECVPGTIDCGGYCKCENNNCIVVPGSGG